ncbi:MAG: T9SS type A sorting domain-containing protein [Sphingobacteriales bacterium]|nr:MAG: T9SS type A sorting domain-containing protein [Sphingobacteriales bacterium]
MKKLLLSSFLCALCTFAFAQPQITSSKMLPFGAKMRYKYVQNTYDIDTTIQGANVTWNFSNLINSSDPEINMQIADPAKTPYGSSFPDANYVRIEDNNYRYFNLSSSKFQRVGSYTTKASKFSDPQVEMVYPLTYGSTNNDTWNNSNSSFDGGTYDYKCIGYGKLTTPGGTFNNVLLVRIIVTEGELYELPFYAWYNADNGAPVLEYTPGDGFFFDAYSTYQANLNTSIDKNELALDVIFNNPVQNMLNISLPYANSDLYNYTIINMLGQTVLAGTGMNALMNIDVNALPAGTYFLSLNNTKNTSATKRVKFVKQ